MPACASAIAGALPEARAAALEARTGRGGRFDPVGPSSPVPRTRTRQLDLGPRPAGRAAHRPGGMPFQRSRHACGLPCSQDTPGGPGHCARDATETDKKAVEARFGVDAPIGCGTRRCLSCSITSGAASVSGWYSGGGRCERPGLVPASRCSRSTRNGLGAACRRQGAVLASGLRAPVRCRPGCEPRPRPGRQDRDGHHVNPIAAAQSRPVTLSIVGAMSIQSVQTPLGYGVIGNTADSGSVVLGSSPGTPASQMLWIDGPASRARSSFSTGSCSVSECRPRRLPPVIR